MDSLSRFLTGGDYQLGRQEIFISKGVIGFMMEFYGIRDTIVQSEGYDMVENLGISFGLFCEEV
jgi:hypothetical protein